jgi:YjjG family noncanonical pyrimidine nucleotidase
MNRYNVVLLDADGTIFDYERAEAGALMETCREIGIDFDPERDTPRYRRINADIWRRFEEGEISAAELSSERFRLFLAELGAAGSGAPAAAGSADPADMSDRYLGHLAEGSFLIDGAKEVVADLSARVTLVLITNGLSRVQRPRFERSGLSAYIRHLVISDEVGSQKPEPGIFARALEPFSGVARAEALMVGDSLSSDIRGGINYGVPTCWYNPDGEENTEGLHPTHEINSLEELLFLV